MFRDKRSALVLTASGLDSRIDDVVLARLAESTEGHYVARQPVLCYEHEIERTLPSRPKDILTEFKGDFSQMPSTVLAGAGEDVNGLSGKHWADMSWWVLWVLRAYL